MPFEIVNQDLRFALLHAAPPARDAMAAVLALDETLGAIVAHTRDLFVGQLRLTWWHEALSTLQPSEHRGQPILDALAASRQVEPLRLLPIVEGWEALLDPLPLPDAALLAYATGRGATLFDAISRLSCGVTASSAGEVWALAEFANRCSDADTVSRAWSIAAARPMSLPAGLPRPLRILARLAHADVVARARVERTRWRLLRAAW